jgi:hypothetical protein
MTAGSHEDDDVDPTASVVRISAAKSDVAAGAALFGLAAWLWHGAADIDVASSNGVGPAFFPRAVAILLAGGSLLLVLQGLAPRLFGIRSDKTIQVQRPGNVLAAIVIVIVYASLLRPLTYYPATALLLPCMLWAAGLRRPVAIVACTIGFLAFTKILFETLLGTPLP